MGKARLRSLVTVALLVTAVAPFAASAEPSGVCPSRVTTTGDGWRRTAAPAFVAGPTEVVSFGVTPDGRTTYATNGVAVARSGDGGCTWASSFVLPETPSAELPFSRDLATVDDVAAGSKRVYVVVRDQAVPRVLVSKDGGRTWKLSDLHAVHPWAPQTPMRLAIDETGDNAYLKVNVSGIFTGIGEVLYATHDGGASWTPRAVDVESGNPPVMGIENVAVDPLSGKDVWITSSMGLFHSSDGGASWNGTNSDLGYGLGALAVTHRRGGRLQVVAASAQEPIVHVKGASGSWTTINAPAIALSVTGGRSAAQVAIATAKAVYELEPDTLKWLPIHTGAPALSRLTSDNASTPSFHACVCGTANGALWSRVPRRATESDPGGRDPDAPPPGGYPGYFGCAPDKKDGMDPATYAPSAVTSRSREVTLEPGKSVTLPTRFRVRPRELDLYFLLDTGFRSQYFGCEAKQGAVWAADQLALTRNLRVGIGQYRDYNFGKIPGVIDTGCLTKARTDYVYRRDLRVGPVDSAFRQTMAAVDVNLCASDHAGLTGLLQATTGEGQKLASAGASPLDIRPQQQAAFGQDAYKVIVHVAGGYLETPENRPGHLGPRFATVIDAMKEADVKQVGIFVPFTGDKKHHGEDPVRAETGLEDLQKIAQGTGTTATREVTCSRVVKTKVRPGEPLVCTFVDDEGQSNKKKKGDIAPPMGRQMVDLVGALRDAQPMRLNVASGDARITAAPAAARRPLDYLQPHTLDYSVTYTCGAKDVGTVKEVTLAGEVGDTVVATTTTTVRCGTVPPPGAPPEVERQQQELSGRSPLPLQAGAVVGNAPPNVNVGHQPATQAQGQSQTNPQMQTSLSGVAVPQEQGEPQLAYVDTNLPDAEQQELAMSDISRGTDTVPAWATLGGAGLMACAAGALALRARTSVTPAVVRERADPRR